MDEWLNSDWYEPTDESLEKIQEMLNFAWNGFNEDAEAVDVLMISPEGRFALKIPYGSLEPGNIYAGNTVDDTLTSCSGSCDAGNCTLEKAGFGKIRFCVGCDSGCTIDW